MCLLSMEAQYHGTCLHLSTEKCLQAHSTIVGSCREEQASTIQLLHLKDKVLLSAVQVEMGHDTGCWTGSVGKTTCRSAGHHYLWRHWLWKFYTHTLWKSANLNYCLQDQWRQDNSNFLISWNKMTFILQFPLLLCYFLFSWGAHQVSENKFHHSKHNPPP